LMSRDTVDRLGLPESDRQFRVIVAATTKKRALELLSFLDVSRGEFNDYWCETGNATELAVAQAEGVWVALKQWPNDAKNYRHFFTVHFDPSR
jgi:hypothetical protein